MTATRKLAAILAASTISALMRWTVPVPIPERLGDLENAGSLPELPSDPPLNLCIDPPPAERLTEPMLLPRGSDRFAGFSQVTQIAQITLRAQALRVVEQIVTTGQPPEQLFPKLHVIPREPIAEKRETPPA